MNRLAITKSRLRRFKKVIFRCEDNVSRKTGNVTVELRFNSFACNTPMTRFEGREGTTQCQSGQRPVNRIALFFIVQRYR